MLCLSGKRLPTQIAGA
ncbi:hypothetical protein cypCar_00033364 [Cyprinus carpio]|nr:hypothetical protein cypCar_00033364 [Cyprinus carpio]